jgi:hypothetical protein
MNTKPPPHDHKPSHPKVAAAVLMIGVVVLIALVSAADIIF